MRPVFYNCKWCKIICQRGSSTVPVAGSNGGAGSPLWVSSSRGSTQPLSKECFLAGCAFVIAKRESDGLIQWFLDFVLRHSVHHSCSHSTGQAFSWSSQCVRDLLWVYVFQQIRHQVTEQKHGTRVSTRNENILPNSKQFREHAQECQWLI